MAAVSVPRSANASCTCKRHRRQSPQNVQQNVVVYLVEDRENSFGGHFDRDRSMNTKVVYIVIYIYI